MVEGALVSVVTQLERGELSDQVAPAEDGLGSDAAEMLRTIQQISDPALRRRAIAEGCVGCCSREDESGAPRDTFRRSGFPCAHQ
jgi:hypothetical protein